MREFLAVQYFDGYLFLGGLVYCHFDFTECSDAECAGEPVGPYSGARVCA